MSIVFPVLLILALITPVQAAPVALGGNFSVLSGEGWELQDVSWNLSGNGLSLLKIATAEIDQSPVSLSEIVLSCPDLQFTSQAVQCFDGQLQAQLDDEKIIGQWQGEGSKQGVVGSISVTLQGLGQVTVSLDAQGQIQIDAEELSVAGLATYFPNLLPQTLVDLDAMLTATVKLQWPIDGGTSIGAEPAISGEFSIKGLSFDSTDGTLAGAELELSGTGNSLVEGSGRRVFSVAAAIHAGELLLDPAYISFTDTPDLQLSANGFQGTDGAMTIDHWRLTDGDSLDASGDVAITAEGQLRSLSVNLGQLALAQAWPRYLSAMADGKGFDGVTAEGSMQGQLRLSAGQLEQWSAAFDQVTLSTDDDRYAIRTLDGLLDYSAVGDSADSTIQWESVKYYTLLVGPTVSHFFIGGGQLQLLQPVFLPVLDGGLQIDELVVDNSDSGQAAMDFRGELKPMALDQITRALGWPELQGTLGGSIPQVRLRGQVIEVGGAVVIDVFGGQVIMNQLKLERIFGVLPTLAADVEINNVDLEQMTGAFSFGKIEGVLVGQVKDLRLLDWRPVAFDLDLHTRREEGRRQRISQRAVDNLSSIGGGVAALGSSVLKIFEDFGYKELGLSCELRNNTCTMGGVGDVGNGYYLVRGSGLPRIDIKGFSRQVDWPQLVRRLQAATESGPVSVE